MTKSITSFTDQLASSRNELIRLARGKEHGIDTWYYVQIDKRKFPIYQQRMRRGDTININHYGNVLYSGWGQNPPEYVTAKITESYS